MLSFSTSPGERLGKYVRLANSTPDLESEIRQSSDVSDRFTDDDLPRILEYNEKVDFRQPRRTRRLVGLLLVVVFGTVAISALFFAKSVPKDDLILRLKSQYKPEQQIIEVLPNCTTCAPYSALPDWPLPFESHDSFSDQAMQSWIAKGQLLSSNNQSRTDFSQHTRLDGITFWVNGSDPRHKAARDHFAQNVHQIDYRPRLNTTQSSLKKRSPILSLIQGLQNDDKRFREQNELLYNLRSAQKSLKKSLRTLHVISTDYWDNAKNEIQGQQDWLFDSRRGQLPSWLNTSSDLVAFGGEVRQQAPAFRMHHDWDTFAPMVKTREDIRQWKMRRLPSFNSIAAEAVLGVNLPGLSENSFLASDDMFLGQTMSTADFVTPLYGPVLHLNMHLQIKPSNNSWSLGEMSGLRYSVHLLHTRFGTRQFPYPVHVHKILSKPLLIESRMMWKEDFEKATEERFRGEGKMANSHMLLNGLTVERHREALLWSFFVSKIDTDGNGELDGAEKKQAFQWMGTDGSRDITGRMIKRSTTKPDSIQETLDGVSFSGPLSSQYMFSSMDGYSLAVPSSDFSGATDLLFRDGPPRFWPSKTDNEKQSRRFSTDFCRVSMSTCWPKKDEIKTSDVFTHFAFQEPSCGDCLIMHLVGQSGPTGLEAFLPAEGLTFPSTQREEVPLFVPAHLSLDNDWKTIDFSLSTVASINRIGWNRRDFSIHLIQRYNYVVGSASASFRQLTSPSSARLAFTRLQKTKPAFICLNDDIRWKLQEVRHMMRDWFESMWPSSTTRLPFEKLYI